jgi:hypothetical protein
VRPVGALPGRTPWIGTPLSPHIPPAILGVHEPRYRTNYNILICKLGQVGLYLPTPFVGHSAPLRRGFSQGCMGAIRSRALLTLSFPSSQEGIQSLNAGFISGSPRYNYGKTSWDIPHQYIEKRERLRAVAAQFGADLRTAALQFSAAPDVAAVLIVGAHTEAQVLANVSSMQATIPAEFWAELKRQNLIEQNAPTPTEA